MKALRHMSLVELAAYVSNRLRAQGIEVVLSGGACVTIYSRGRYVSMDMDLVNVHLVPWRRLQDAMTAIGFREENRYFKHPGIQWLVEFPPGPLSVGGEPVRDVAEMTLPTGRLRLLSPTDCVKDRLAGYYHWHDQQCLEQAILVAAANAVDIYEIRRWSAREDRLAEFRRIQPRLLKHKGRQPPASGGPPTERPSGGDDWRRPRPGRS